MQHKTAFLTIHSVVCMYPKACVRRTLVGYYLAAFQQKTCYYNKTNQININRIKSPGKNSGEFKQN